MSTSNLHPQNSQLSAVKTYKQDAISFLTHKLTQKYLKSYFETLKSFNPQNSGRKTKNYQLNDDQITNNIKRLKNCSKKSFSSLKKAIDCYKELENSLEMIQADSPNANRLKRSNDLRRSIQAIGARHNSSVDNRKCSSRVMDL